MMSTPKFPLTASTNTSTKDKRRDHAYQGFMTAARDAPVVLLLGRLKNSAWVGSIPPCFSRVLERLPPSARASSGSLAGAAKWPGGTGRVGMRMKGYAPIWPYTRL